jgi:hypothetical protein
MRMCEYANNLLDMGLLVYLTKKNRRIIYGDLDYITYILNVDFSITHFYNLYMSLYNIFDYYTYDGPTRLVRFIRLHVNEYLLEADIEKIHGIAPYMSIKWWYP